MLLSFKRKKRANKKASIEKKDKSYIDSYKIENPIDIEFKEDEKQIDSELECAELSSSNCDINKCRFINLIDEDNLIIKFSEHIEKYVGETVTIFTSSGGESGSGFTGIILSSNKEFIRILSKIGPSPECSLGNCNSYPNSMNYISNKYHNINPFYPYIVLHNWNYRFRNYYNRLKYNFNPYMYNSNLVNSSQTLISSLGSIVDIRTKHITAFVHNTI